MSCKYVKCFVLYCVHVHWKMFRVNQLHKQHVSPKLVCCCSYIVLPEVTNSLGTFFLVNKLLQVCGKKKFFHLLLASCNDNRFCPWGSVNHAQTNHDLHNSLSTTNTFQSEKRFMIRLNKFQSSVNTVPLLNTDQHHFPPSSTMKLKKGRPF